MKKTIFLLTFLLVAQFSFSQIVFSDVVINADNKVLFTTSYTNLLNETRTALVTSSIQSAKPAILTCTPENLTVLNEGKTLQIRNWYGTAHYSTETDSLRWKEQASFFKGGNYATHKVVEPISVSPDGLWTVQFVATSSAYGKLVLTDIKKNVSVTIAEDLPLKLSSVPVQWAPDSSVLIYEKGDGIYFAKPSLFFVAQPLQDSYRKLGEGTINSIHWASADLLIYLLDGNIFSIPVRELQIRALYANVIPLGRFLGKVPASFNAREDKFWTNKNGKSLILVQNNRNITYFTLNGADFEKSRLVDTEAHAAFKENVYSVEVFWHNNDMPVVWVESFFEGQIDNQAFRFANNTLVPLETPLGSHSPLLSANKELLVLNSNNGLHVYDIATWQKKAQFFPEAVETYAWKDNKQLYVGGIHSVRTWDITTGKSEVLFLSKADRFGWNADGSKIIAYSAGIAYEYESKTNTWLLTSEQMQTAQIQNDKFRVFLDKDTTGNFENSIYIRSIQGLSDTHSIFADTVRPRSASHVEQKNISFVFDALDNADGLAVILKTLQKYSIKATFFINGTFIERYPQAVREIVAAGHQCGSMFYTNFDFADPLFTADEDFVLQGLARNEEFFFSVTGKDLSPIWHSPNYMINSSVRDIATKAGYTYIDRGFAPLDWVSLEVGMRTPGLYISSSEIIEVLVSSLRPNIVVPISVGIPSGNRFDYLYNRLDILIQAAFSAGYDIVPVSDK